MSIKSIGSTSGGSVPGPDALGASSGSVVFSTASLKDVEAVLNKLASWRRSQTTEGIVCF